MQPLWPPSGRKSTYPNVQFCQATSVLQYRIGGRAGRTRRYTIGKHGEKTPEQARKVAKSLSAQVELGIDPIDAKRKMIASDERARASAIEHARLSRDLAFNAYAERFIAHGLKAGARERTRADYAAMLRNHATPVLGSKSLPEIRRADIVRVREIGRAHV